MKTCYLRKNFILLFAALLGTAAFSTLSAADQDPKAITPLAPAYPGEMQHAGREGAVLVAFTITPQGDVADAVVVSSTQRTFEASTLAAVKQWKFAPGMKDGIAVSTSARQLITFMDSTHDVSATTTRLTAKLRVRNPQPMVASTWQPDFSNPVVRLAASGTALTPTQP